jgi:hypothetical protein
MGMNICCYGCGEALQIVDPEEITVRPCSGCQDELAQMLHDQRMWQIEGMRRSQDSANVARNATIPRYTFMDPAEPPGPRGAMEYLTYNHTALVVELSEMMAETGWKPWATSNHINEAALGEWIDAWHFMMNILWMIAGQGVLGDAHVLAATVKEHYDKKRQVNLDRQLRGYDGISTKCRECKRDFEDNSVYCTVERCEWYGVPGSGSARAQV